MSLGYTFSALFSMLLVILTGRRTGKADIKNYADLEFNRLVIIVSVYCLVDAFWGLFRFSILKSQLGFTAICYAVYLMAGISTLFFFNYMVGYIGAGKRSNPILNGLSVILLLMQALLLISNEYTHNMFYVNSEGTYFPGEGRIQLLGLQLINYVIVFLFGLYRLSTGGKGEKRKLAMGLLYAVLPGVFSLGQIMAIDVAMYSFGFGLAILAVFLFEKSSLIMRQIDNQHRIERDEQLSIINGMAGDFSTIYSVDLETGGFIVYNRTGDEELLHKVDNSSLDYFKVALEKGRRMVHKDDLLLFYMVMDRKTIKKRFETEPSFSVVLRVFFGKSTKYIEYRFTDNKIGKRERVVIGVYDVDKTYRKKLRDEQLLQNAKNRQVALEEETQLLEKAAFRDIMTGLYNRRAYEDYVDEARGMTDGADFTYVSLDVNGLKAVNDDIGHDAGDELITGAAFCMKKALGDYGIIFRHGGDEFSAILHAPEEKLAEIFKGFDEEIGAFKGRLVDEISVSYGYVTAGEAGASATIEELAKIADQRMYEAKRQHYARKGIDRRGQSEAYDAIRKSYLKVLKVDLKTDSFGTVYMGESEAGSDKGYDSRISKWIHDFAESGNVHPEDREAFMSQLTLSEIRDHFAAGRDVIALHYRRKSDSGYNNALLEIIPSENFSEDNQIVFLYVKNIH